MLYLVISIAERELMQTKNRPQQMMLEKDFAQGDKSRAMTKLTDYLKQTGMTARDFAALIGISQAFMSEINSGKKMPHLDLAFIIQNATNGAVPCDYWPSPDGPKHMATKKEPSHE